MNVKRLALTLVVVVSLLAVGSGAVSAANTASPDAGAGADMCTDPYSVDDDGAESDVGTNCTGGGGCMLYCMP